MSKAVVKSLTSLLEQPTVKAQFKKALDKHADIFMAGVIEIVSNDKYLQGCEPQSILKSALTLATLKLPINKSLGFGYLVPYKGTVQPQIGYKGLIQLAQRTSLYKCINADVVYEGELISKNKMTGEIDLSGDRVSDEVIGYFAYFSTNYGFSKCLYWSRQEIQSHAKRFSQSYNSKHSPWQTDFDAMAKKTVLKHLISHYGPMTIDIGDAISKVDEEPVEFDDSEVNNLTASENFDIEIEAETVVSNSENTEKVKPRYLDEIMSNGVNLDDEPEF